MFGFESAFNYHQVLWKNKTSFVCFINNFFVTTHTSLLGNIWGCFLLYFKKFWTLHHQRGWWMWGNLYYLHCCFKSCSKKIEETVQLYSYTLAQSQVLLLLAADLRWFRDTQLFIQLFLSYFVQIIISIIIMVINVSLLTSTRR